MAKEFRATLWFKKGDLDASMAATAATSGDDLAPAAVDLMPVEDRYLDDGTVTAADTEVYGLHIGGTRALPRVAGAVALTGEGDVAVLVRDIKRGRIAAIVAVCTALSMAAAAAVLLAL
jgi:hypothetical protein